MPSDRTTETCEACSPERLLRGSFRYYRADKKWFKVGIQYYADCVREAGCESSQDMDKLKLSWQGYNYGNGYISWALEKFAGLFGNGQLVTIAKSQLGNEGGEKF